MTTPKLHLDSVRLELAHGAMELGGPCTLEAGYMYLIEGASGSGKSSLARTLLGLNSCVSPPLAATCKAHLSGVAEQDQILWDERGFRPRSRNHLGYLPQLNALAFIDDLSPEANLSLYSGLPRKEAAIEMEKLAQRFKVWPLPRSLARASGGERMRLSAVRALLPRHPGQVGSSVVIADEPTVGLDARMSREVALSLVEVAAGGERIICVISHDPVHLMAKDSPELPPVPDGTIRITRCRATPQGAILEEVIGSLTLQPNAHTRAGSRMMQRLAGLTDTLGGLALSPLAFVYGVLRMDRHSLRTGARSVLRTSLNLGTWTFVSAASIVVGVTLAFFAFEKMPKREIIEPLFLPEFLREFGLAMLLVLPPLFAALFSTAKTGAAQAARLASSVRSGLHETLALARIQPESYALVPAVLGQTLCLYVTTVLAMTLALGSSALVFLASGSALSLDLALQMMMAPLERAENWQWWLLAKATASGAVGGVLAALLGLRPSRGSESDVSLAVHRTLLWTLLSVLAVQCAFIVAQFG